MSRDLEGWDAQQIQFTREQIARFPNARFPYRALLPLLDALDAALAECTPAAPDEEGLDAAWLEREWTAWKHGHVDLTSEQFAAAVLFRNHLARALASQDKA